MASHVGAAALGFSEDEGSTCESVGAGTVNICTSGGLFVNGKALDPDSIEDLRQQVQLIVQQLGLITTAAAFTAEPPSLSTDLEGWALGVVGSSVAVAVLASITVALVCRYKRRRFRPRRGTMSKKERARRATTDSHLVS